MQLDQILTTLQAPDRESLQRLLQGYGDALNHVPTAPRTPARTPTSRARPRPRRSTTPSSTATAARDSAIVNEALLGTEPGDLSELIFSGNRVFNALLARESQLQDLITNLNTTVGAFAAESENVSETVRLLAPTLRVAPALAAPHEPDPPLPARVRPRRRARHPELPATIAVSGPWLKQTRKLLRRDELGRLAYQLSLTGEPAAQAAVAGPSAVPPDGAAQPLRLQRPDPDGRRRHQRRVRPRRAGLQGVRLRGHRLRRGDAELRRQRALHPLPDRWRTAAARSQIPGGASRMSPSTDAPSPRRSGPSP